MRVLVGLSWWVDSAVAAYLLKQQGFDVVGWFMKNYVSEIEIVLPMMMHKKLLKLLISWDRTYYLLICNKNIMKELFTIFMMAMLNE
jgi:adenylyl- and sulfurtransferase ThiI